LREAVFLSPEAPLIASSYEAAALTQPTTLVLLVLVVALTGAVLAVWYARGGDNTARKQLVDDASRLAEGNLNTRIQGTERSDDVGTLARCLVECQKEMRRANELRSERAESAESAESDRAALTDRLADDFERRVGSTMQSVANSAAELQATSMQLAQIVGQTQDKSRAAARAANQASANVETMAAAAEELSTTIQEVSQSVQTAADTSQRSAKGAEESETQLDQLGGALTEAEGVVSSINEVAEQTNLLALNATIEAARAGEAGRGFSVVAGEVKNLANQTKTMTDTIGNRIEAVRQSARAAIEATRQIISDIKEISDTYTSVAASVEQQGGATSEISRNAHEASQGTSKASEEIQAVEEITEQANTVSDQVQSASENLSEQAEALREQVQSFLAELRASQDGERH
jgi:methyl-accepting chemotaxis protein